MRAIQDIIYHDIQSHFAQQPEAWDSLARRECDPRSSSSSTEAVAAAIQQYETGLAQLGDAAAVSQMYILYRGFLQERLEALLCDQSAVQQAAAAAQQLLKLCQRAHDAQAADQDLYSIWMEVAVKLGQRKVSLRLHACFSCSFLPFYLLFCLGCIETASLNCLLKCRVIQFLKYIA